MGFKILTNVIHKKNVTTLSCGLLKLFLCFYFNFLNEINAKM